ncbi:MAG: diaminopimelate decarboxylase [Flavobacteriales bacterium]
MESLLQKQSPLKKHVELFASKVTPFYYYDLDLLEKTVSRASQAAARYNYKLHYAFKANWNQPILEIIRKYDCGADCVTGNEVLHALKNGFLPEQIVYAGVGKTDREIIIGLENNIFSFNCESLPEIEIINELASRFNKKANIALRINPNVNAKTHHYITTGLEENKFGINPWEFDKVMSLIRSCENIALTGLHFHIGSQITDLQVYTNLCSRVNEINHYFTDNGFMVNHLNLGGGIGVDYHHPDENPIIDFEGFFSMIHSFLSPLPHQEIHFEPGRCIVAQCGSLISRVTYVKKGVNTEFLILDAGMTELMRPALYQAFHKIENLSSNTHEATFYDVVGPICESSDCFGKKIKLPISKRDDIIAIRTVGAYGEVMASRYNMRELNESVYTIH